MNYNLLREAADSWGLLFLAVVFVLAVWRALRPAARDAHRSASLIPFNQEDPDDV